MFFSRLAEIFPILGKGHINFFSFFLTLGLFFISGVFLAVNWRKNESVTLVLIFLMIGLLSVPFAVWPGNAFAHWKEALFINNTVLIFLCFAAIRNEKQLMRMVHTFLISSSVLVTALFINPKITLDGRVSVTNSYDPNDIALILAVAFPIFFSQFWFSGKKGKIVLCILIGFIISGILKSGSRGGQLALLVGIGLIFFSSKIKLRILYKALILFIIVGGLLSSQAEPLKERWASVLSGEDYNIANLDDAGGGRLAIWRSGIVLFSENFLLGVGVGNSSTAMGEKHGSNAWITIHNSYIQVALELGIFGLIVFLLMLRLIWTNCTRVIEMTCNVPHKKQFFILSFSIRVSLIVYLIASFFLSQAFSIIIPFFLILSNRLHFFVADHNKAEL